MNKRLFTSLVILFIAFIYLLLLYLIFGYHRIIDFTPFYISTKLLISGLNPYPISKVLPANLNPPFFLFIFYPLGLLDYSISVIIWSMISLSLGAIGAYFAFNATFSEEFQKKYGLYLYLLYFSFFPTLMDTSIVQVGAILLFFTMIGYHFYLRQNDSLAGLFWGLIIALKLFPGLLFFFVLKQRRYKVFFIMLTTVFFAILLPLLFYGPTIYKQYLSMLSVIYWFGDSWNASIYGYIFRLYMNLRHPGQNLLTVEIFYLIAFSFLLVCYLFAMGPKEIKSGADNPINHQPFCLTLAMMVFLSPFGWLYYFPLLIFPLLLTAILAFEEKSTKLLIPLLSWTLCFFLINFPQAYVMGKNMHSFAEKIGLFSFSFYGLALLVILVIYRQKIPSENTPNLLAIKEDERKLRFIRVLLIYLLFGLVVPFNGFLIRISMDVTGDYDVKNLYQLIH